MSDGTKAPELSVDAVFNRVLAAEQEARDAVAACRREADEIVAQAERDARRIARRGDHRIRKGHAIADRSIARALADLHGPAAARADLAPDLAPDPELVAELTARLARELTESP
jgi:regulator of protease activity HflC (stomatin/prohibitin superfamily)